MDNITYDRLVAAFDAGGEITYAERSALLAAARARGDARVVTRLLLASGDEQSVIDLALSGDHAVRRAVVDGLASIVNEDTAWHVLTAIAEADADSTRIVDQALAAWSEDARRMPQRWFDDLQRGAFAAHHRLVRELPLEGDEVALLTRPGVETSLGGLTGLALAGCSREMLQAVLRTRGLDSVRTLKLEWVEIPSLLASTHAFPALKTLDVLGGLSAQVAADLIVGSSFPNLESLVLTGAGSMAELTRALAGRSTRRATFALELIDLTLDSVAVAALVAQPALAGVNGLSFRASCGELGPNGAAAIARAPWVRNLQQLDVFNQELGDAAMADLVRAMDGGELRSLCACHNDLSVQTVDALSRAYLPHLATLDLSNNPLDDAGLARVLSNPSFSSRLVNVELLGTQASVATARALVKGGVSLELVNLGERAGDEVAAVLAGGRFQHLKRLQLLGASDDALEQLVRPGRFVTNQRLA